MTDFHEQHQLAEMQESRAVAALKELQGAAALALAVMPEEGPIYEFLCSIHRHTLKGLALPDGPDECSQPPEEDKIVELFGKEVPEPLPQPSRKDGGEPCGECHIQPGETCDICGAKHTEPAGNDIQFPIIGQKSARVLALEAALAPLVEIADKFDANELDEEARKMWGSPERGYVYNSDDPHTIELYSGRGGYQLLTLGHCLDAREVVRNLKPGAK